MQIVSREAKLSLAQTISNFLYEYNTYEWNDQDYDEHAVIDKLIAQFDNLEVFVKANKIIKNVSNSDEIYQKLCEFLKI